MNKINIKYFITVTVIFGAVLIVGIALFNSQDTKKVSTESANSIDAMVGKPFPDIQLMDKDGKIYTTQMFRGKNTVLFFSEGMMCYPACWDEIAALGTDPRLNNNDTEVLSVVTDRPQDWMTAQNKMPDLAKAMMLFDSNSAVSRQLGVINLPSSMHMGSMPGHTYFVLDKQGTVRYVYDDPNMAKNGDKIAAEILKLNH